MRQFMHRSITPGHCITLIMPDVRLPIILIATLAIPAAAVDGQQRRAVPTARGTITEVTIQQRLIIRIPRVPTGGAPMAAPAPAAPPPPIRWVERKAEKCVEVQALAGATIAGVDTVDLLLLNGKRLRARFNSECPALDFYSGLYLRMNSDGKLCSNRDAIRSRAGGECRIQSFSTLIPTR